MVINVNIYEPDYSTSRETYDDILDGTTDDTLVIRNLTFGHTAAGGFLPCSFDIWKDATTVDVVEGDIVEIEVDSTVRYFGKVESVSPDYSDTSQVYEDTTHVRVNPILGLADRFNYSLRESDGGTVTTTIQNVYNDVFLGSVYSGKGQDNNLPITTSLSHISYSAGNNTLSGGTINVSYANTPYAEVAKDMVRLHNGTLDLTIVEPFIWYQKVDKAMYTEQRVTSLLNTFDMDDGDFPTRTAVDLADDGYRVESETSGVLNYFILNGDEIDSSYTTRVSNSQTDHGIRQAPPLDNKNITVEEAAAWLDGFILDLLEERKTYHIRLRKSKYGYSPVWFNGGSDDPNGYIKLTEGGSTEVFNEPFREAIYTLDTSGWDIRITAGGVRPNVSVRSRILTEFTGLGNYDPSLQTNIIEPSDDADVTRVNATEIFDTGEFQVFYKNPQIPITAADVEFKVTIKGGGYWAGGTVTHTYDSSSNPPVYEDPNTPGLYKCTWYNATSGSKIVGTPGTTIYASGLVNDTYYKVHSEITIDNGGVSELLKGAETPFVVRSKTVGDKADDSFTRMPDAEKELVNGNAAWKWFAAGAPPPDAGGDGWFSTNDSVTWTRFDGTAAVQATGTTSGSFTVDSDDSEASFIYYNFGTGGAGLRLNIATPEVEVNHDDGAGWVSLATGATNAISATYSSDLYELKVNSTDGSVTFIKDPLGSPENLFTVTAAGDVKIYSDILPQTDDSFNLGAQANMFANAYIGNVTYTEDIEFTSDGGSTTNGKLEWDGTEGEIFPENIAFGFMD